MPPRRPEPDRVPRSSARLSREAIVTAGVALADRDGLEALSMRRLATELGVNPMSLYHHVHDKDALLEAMLDDVVAAITAVDPPRAAEAPAAAWTDEVRRLVGAARRTMTGHPWAVEVLQQRHSPTAATLGHLDRLLAAMLRGGCSIELAHHALHLLGSRMLGFSQDLFVETSGGPTSTTVDPAARARQAAALAQHYPHVAELARSASHEGGLGGCDDDTEFDFALDVLLDGLERRRLAESRGAVGRDRAVSGRRRPGSG